jgi:hypothetical protein
MPNNVIDLAEERSRRRVNYGLGIMAPFALWWAFWSFFWGIR